MSLVAPQEEAQILPTLLSLNKIKSVSTDSLSASELFEFTGMDIKWLNEAKGFAVEYEYWKEAEAGGSSCPLILQGSSAVTDRALTFKYKVSCTTASFNSSGSTL